MLGDCYPIWDFRDHPTRYLGCLQGPLSPTRPRSLTEASWLGLYWSCSCMWVTTHPDSPVSWPLPPPLVPGPPPKQASAAAACVSQACSGVAAWETELGHGGGNGLVLRSSCFSRSNVTRDQAIPRDSGQVVPFTVRLAVCPAHSLLFPAPTFFHIIVKPLGEST